MGNRPKPTKLKVLLGDPGHQNPKKKLKTEPEPTPGVPDMPRWLEAFPAAVEEWCKLTEILDGMGILTIADGKVIAQCCYLDCELASLAVELQKEGRVVYISRMDSVGNEMLEAKPNPKATQQKALLTEYRMTWGLLGLTPVDRARLSVTDKGKKNKFDGLVGKDGKKQRLG
jgi:P27 family predicted phage terminase small subunit